MNQTNPNSLLLRQWTPYEQTQLSRHGLSQLKIMASDQRPVEYLTGRVEFLNGEFQVSPAVLIPRVETEELVELVLKDIQSHLITELPLQIIDVATGSGAIGLSLWRLLVENQSSAESEIWLSDISSTALAVAQKNWIGLQEKYQDRTTKISAPHFLESDLLAQWPRRESINYLVANLPYIPTHRLAALDSSVRDFEPQLALDGGPDGLRLVNRLLEQAKDCLAKDGVVWLEVDETHTPAQLAELRPEYSYQFFNDSFGKSRFIRATYLFFESKKA